MNYLPRITDKILKQKMDAFGAVLIEGPKGCGKTTTAKQIAKDVIEFQNEDVREELLSVAENMPSQLLKGEKPILFDEWQDAPKIWGAVRKAIDDHQEVGAYILTGSSSASIETPHTGTGRISTMKMYTMSLFESEESNGSVSLNELFNNESSFSGCVSSLSFDDLVFAICRGGWPRTMSLQTDNAKLLIAEDIFHQTYKVDINRISHIDRNPDIAKALMLSYSRNLCTLASSRTIYGDVQKEGKPVDVTLNGYIDDLKKLNIIEDVNAWSPAIRSKTAIRSSEKRNYVDPSIAVSALGLSPEYFRKDFKTLGFLFECLAIRDLKIYSQENGGTVSYYRDRYGLEADCVLHLKDGRYALIEFKLGEAQIEEGAAHLNKIVELLKQYNEHETQCPIRLPELRIIITGTKYGYRREDGVLVIPIGCLKN